MIITKPTFRFSFGYSDPFGYPSPMWTYQNTINKLSFFVFLFFLFLIGLDPNQQHEFLFPFYFPPENKKKKGYKKGNYSHKVHGHNRPFIYAQAHSTSHRKSASTGT